MEVSPRAAMAIARLFEQATGQTLSQDRFWRIGTTLTPFCKARGIPVLYYGSETGFMRGRAEHAGNRNYFGQERIEYRLRFGWRDVHSRRDDHAGLKPHDGRRDAT